jgi:hypothetical protein
MITLQNRVNTMIPIDEGGRVAPHHLPKTDTLEPNLGALPPLLESRQDESPVAIYRRSCRD